MAEENALSSAPATGEVSPPVPTGETVTATETPAAAPIVDETPDPARLKAEIEELKKQREEAERKAIEWRKRKAEERAEYFKTRRGAEPPEPPQELPGVGPEPRAADFDDYDKYVLALTDHRVKKARIEWETQDLRRRNEEAARQRFELREQKLQSGYVKYPDFEDIVRDPTATHITAMIADMLTDCDNAADVAYYLAKNRVEGVAISRMSPIQAARAIAKLDLKFSETPPAAPPPPRTMTNAPPPITPVGSRGEVSKDPNKMTQKEYEAWRASQGARRF